MKKISSILFIILGIALITSCELDNYDYPDASIHGALIDEETGEMVQSDIYDGARIALVEIDTAFENPQRLYLNIKTDGSYRNDLIFSAQYAVPSIEDGNFHATDSTTVTIDGDTEFNMEVVPYIRITDVVFTMDGMDLTATFKLEQTVPDTIHIARLGIYAHTEPTVGQPHRLDDEDAFLGKAAVPDSTYTIEWDISRSSVLDEDVPYFFRVGAVIDLPGARYNYAAAERLTATKN